MPVNCRAAFVDFPHPQFNEKIIHQQTTKNLECNTKEHCQSYEDPTGQVTSKLCRSNSNESIYVQSNHFKIRQNSSIIFPREYDSDESLRNSDSSNLVYANRTKLKNDIIIDIFPSSTAPPTSLYTTSTFTDSNSVCSSTSSRTLTYSNTIQADLPAMVNDCSSSISQQLFCNNYSTVSPIQMFIPYVPIVTSHGPNTPANFHSKNSRCNDPDYSSFTPEALGGLTHESHPQTNLSEGVLWQNYPLSDVAVQPIGSRVPFSISPVSQQQYCYSCVPQSYQPPALAVIPKPIHFLSCSPSPNYPNFVIYQPIAASEQHIVHDRCSTAKPQGSEIQHAIPGEIPVVHVGQLCQNHGLAIDPEEEMVTRCEVETRQGSSSRSFSPRTHSQNNTNLGSKDHASRAQKIFQEQIDLYHFTMWKRGHELSMHEERVLNSRQRRDVRSPMNTKQNYSPSTLSRGIRQNGRRQRVDDPPL